MRKEHELKKIAAGIIAKEITVSTDIVDINDIEKVFPTVLDLTLRDALKIINRGVYCIFQWNDAKNEQGVFTDWEELSEEEWDFIDEIVSKAPEKPKNPRRKRRPRRHGHKKTENQRVS